MRKARTLILLPILLGVSVATYAQSPIPIVKPTEIMKPGKYIVMTDITVANSPKPVILVTADRVELDLNGFTLTNNDTLIQATGAGRLAIRSGKLVGNTDTAAMIDVIGTAVVVVEDVEMSGGLSGIELRDVGTYEIRRNRLLNIGGDCEQFGCNDAHGIFVDAARSSGTVEDNVILDTQSDGIRLEAETRGALIRNNTIDVPSAGILVQDGFLLRIERNRISSNTTGIDLSASYSTVEGNNVSGGFVNAISLTSGEHCLIFDNVASGALNYGIALVDSNYNQVDRNVVIGNYEGGIYITGNGNTYGRNSVRNNFGTCPGGVSPCDNVAVCDLGTDNTSFGDNLAPGGC